ncbi:MAG TPA: aspartate-semialdehyde dehydrogenase [Longimicrobiales bacterium]|nr:aspartate-semialdehyde dehydrogenase [Longimicrobiales bacterium]
MKVAVLGATGAVGRTMLQVLEERLPAVDEVVPLASPRSAGERLPWRGGEREVRVPGPGSFEGCEVALFSAGGGLSREWAPRAAEEGAVVVDNSSAWRMDPEVPLVVPEVNAGRVSDRPKGIIANPNCSTIQLVVPLEGIRRAAGLGRVVVTTYQSVSGAGQKGVAAYRAERRDEALEGSPFPARIFGNVIPRIGPMGEDGWTEEELKMRNETRRILDLPELPVTATCVRVPVEVGHAVVAAVETERPLTVSEAEEALSSLPGVRVFGNDRDPVPVDAAGHDDILVGRLRRDPDRANVLHMWIVADNLRKGAATNAVQIADAVLRG